MFAVEQPPRIRSRACRNRKTQRKRRSPIDSERVLYQDSSVSTLRTPRDLITKHTGTSMLPTGTLMFCGTPGAIGGIRPATRFEMELKDPVLNRSLTHGYDIEALPVIS